MWKKIGIAVVVIAVIGAVGLFITRSDVVCPLGGYHRRAGGADHRRPCGSAHAGRRATDPAARGN